MTTSDLFHIDTFVVIWCTVIIKIEIIAEEHSSVNVAHLCFKLCDMFLVEGVSFLQLFLPLLQLMSL